jgi:hypothetical protein
MPTYVIPTFVDSASIILWAAVVSMPFPLESCLRRPGAVLGGPPLFWPLLSDGAVRMIPATFKEAVTHHALAEKK